MSAFRDGIFQGKVAFVAGGSSGINLGIAKRLAELGARVAVAGRNAEKAQKAALAIGHGAKGYSCDVREYVLIRGVMETIVAEWGPMDIVVSGAAGNFLAPVARLSANGFHTIVDIDLNGTFNVFRGCYHLIRKPGASLIAITAGQAINAMTLQAHACAAKGGSQPTRARLRDGVGTGGCAGQRHLARPHRRDRGYGAARARRKRHSREDPACPAQALGGDCGSGRKRRVSL